jgi:hypothetical protein
MIPFVVNRLDNGFLIIPLVLTDEFGIVFDRGIINAVRNLRFFIDEIITDAFHYSADTPQNKSPYQGNLIEKVNIIL